MRNITSAAGAVANFCALGAILTLSTGCIPVAELTVLQNSDPGGRTISESSRSSSNDSSESEEFTGGETPNLSAGSESPRENEKWIIYPGESSHHQIGEPAGTAWRVTTPVAGFLTYGPYTDRVRFGGNRVTFSLEVQKMAVPGEGGKPVAILDVMSQSGQKLITQRVLQWDEFKAPGSAQDFHLDFHNAGETAVEFRVYLLKAVAITHHRTTVFALNQLYPPGEKAGPAEIAAGRNSALFSVSVDDLSGGNQKLLELEVLSGAEAKVLGRREISGSELLVAGMPQDFAVVFDLPVVEDPALEFRVRSTSGANFTHHSTRLTWLAKAHAYDCLPRVAVKPTFPVTRDWRDVRELFNRYIAELDADIQRKAGCVPIQTSRGVNASDLPNAEQVEFTRRAGLKTVRDTVYWHLAVEPDGVTLREAYMVELEARFARYTKAGAEILMVVHSPPHGLGYGNRRVAYEKFAQFMANLVVRLPQVAHWQLFNEMDAAFTDLFGAYDASKTMRERGFMYAEMLKLVSPSIRAARPSARIMTGPVAVSDTDFLEGMYAAGGGPYVDSISVHSYGVPIHWTSLNVSVDIRRLMRKYGDEDKELWLTEFGVMGKSIVDAWGIPGEETDLATHMEEKQSQLIREVFDHARKYSLYERAIVFSMNFGSGEGVLADALAERVAPRPAHDFGYPLMREDAKTPKPILQWLMDNPHQRLPRIDNGCSFVLLNPCP